MNLYKKLKLAEALQEEAKVIRNELDKETRKKWEPLENKAQELKQDVYKQGIKLIKNIKSDMKKFVKELKKKYTLLKNLEIESDVLYFSNTVDVGLNFEIPLESLVKYEERIKKPKPPKGRVVKENKKPKKLKTKGKK